MAFPEPGFIFWGIFLVCGAVWIAYAAWMIRANAHDARRRTGIDSGKAP